MTVNRLSGNRVLVVLCGNEMKDYKLEFEKLSLENTHSRRVILRLIQLACRKSGIETQGKNVSIEALMLNEGCYFLMTVERKNKKYRIKSCSGLCCTFQNCDDLMNAARELYQNGLSCGKNELYEKNGQYYLVFNYPLLPTHAYNILAEFSSIKRGRITAARIRETSDLICPKNAVQSLGIYLV